MPCVNAQVEKQKPELPLTTPTTRQDEQKFWESCLTRLGLSMDQGSSPRWITYGWQYREADTPFDYNDNAKRPDMNEQRNEKNAEQLIALMAEGLSLRKAAKQLGVAPGNASVTLKRYRDRQARYAAGTQVPEEIIDEATN